jgi:hypothetical protein
MIFEFVLGGPLPMMNGFENFSPLTTVSSLDDIKTSVIVSARVAYTNCEPVEGIARDAEGRLAVIYL